MSLGNAWHVPALLWQLVLAAQLTVQADKGYVKPGERLRVVVQLEQAANEHYVLQEPGDKLGGLSIVQRQVEPLRLLGAGSATAQQRQTYIYELQTTQEGAYVLPPWQANQPPAKTLLTQPLYVEVSAQSDPAPAALHDIKPLHAPPPRLAWHWLGWLGLAVLSLALAVWGWRWRRQRRAMPRPAPAAAEVALAALQHLQTHTAATPRAWRQATFAISEIVRTYVERRFDLNATDLTTEEIFARLADLAELKKPQRLLLKEFLHATDKVKYAGFAPNQKQWQTTCQSALAFVRATLPQARESAPTKATPPPLPPAAPHA